MQVLLMVLGGRDYALPAGAVLEVVPRTRLKPIDGAAPWIAGLMDYRGMLLPVIDGASLMGGEPVPTLLGSRIIVLEVPATRRDGGAGMSRFGLLCELIRERTELSTDDGWQSGEGVDRASVISLIGRVNSTAVALIEPLRIVEKDAMLLPPAEAPSVPSQAIAGPE